MAPFRGFDVPKQDHNDNARHTFAKFPNNGAFEVLDYAVEVDNEAH